MKIYTLINFNKLDTDFFEKKNNMAVLSWTSTLGQLENYLFKY